MQRTGSFLLAFSGFLLLVPVAAQHPSEVLFDQSVLRTIQLTMAPTDWAALVRDVQTNTTYPCTFAWNGLQLPQVGVRIKGQSSRVTGTKPSLRFDFNHYTNQKLLQLTKLDAQARKGDPSMLRERLIYGVARRRGVPAPRAMHVRLEVNGAYIGLYTILDQFDQAEMLRTHFATDKGNLYKADNMGGGDTTLWRGFDPAAYIDVFYDWERKETTQPNDLIALLDFVNHSTDSEFEQGLPRRIDVDGLLEYCAVNQVIGNEDWMFSDVLNWAVPVVRGGPWGHNYYWYFPSEQSDLRCRTILWDVDASMSYWFTPEPGRWVTRPILMGFEHSVLSRRVMAVPGWRSTYMEKVAAILDEAFDPHDLVAELDTIFEQIQAAAELDTWKPWRNDEFHYGVALLRQDIPVRVEDVRTQLGCPGSTFTSYGEGCPGTADRVPLHHGSGMAVLGRTFWLRLRNVIPDTAAAMVAGASATSLDLAAVGMPGCTMLVQPTVDVMARTSAQGLLTLPITLPNDPQLLGVQLFSQFAVVDPGASTPLPVIVSNGIETRIGQCR
jgi:spore coat protein CotH